MQIKSRTYGNVFPLPTRRTIEVVRMVGLSPELDVSGVNDGTEEKNYIENKKWKYLMNVYNTFTNYNVALDAKLHL